MSTWRLVWDQPLGWSSAVFFEVWGFCNRTIKSKHFSDVFLILWRTPANRCFVGVSPDFCGVQRTLLSEPPWKDLPPCWTAEVCKVCYSVSRIQLPAQLRDLAHLPIIICTSDLHPQLQITLHSLPLLKHFALQRKTSFPREWREPNVFYWSSIQPYVFETVGSFPKTLQPLDSNIWLPGTRGATAALPLPEKFKLIWNYWIQAMWSLVKWDKFPPLSALINGSVVTDAGMARGCL